jgi:F-type H+-transporting ATPase subunit alpha
MKAVAGKLKLDLAQFREVQAFSQFASDLDKATQAQLARGLRFVEVLKQPPYKPVPLEKQVASIYSANNGYLDDLPVEAIRRFESEFIAFITDKYPEIFATISRDKTLSPETSGTLDKALAQFKEQFKP